MGLEAALASKAEPRAEEISLSGQVSLLTTIRGSKELFIWSAWTYQMKPRINTRMAVPPSQPPFLALLAPGTTPP